MANIIKTEEQLKETFVEFECIDCKRIKKVSIWDIGQVGPPICPCNPKEPMGILYS